MSTNAIRIAILANASQAKRELNSVAGTTQGVGSKIGKFGKAAGVAAVAGFAVAGAAAVKFGVDSIKAASNAQQSLGATETIFGKFADTVVTDSKRAATQVGLDANTYRENANLIGALFANQGVATDKLAGKTKAMIKTGADLSATFGGSTTQAVEALSSAFKGEFDPLEKYGISLKASTVNAEAMRLANVKSTTEFNNLSTAQQNAFKQQATTNLIQKQSAKSAGAFAKESNTLAHQQQVLGAQFNNLKVTLGNALLPILTKVFTFVNKNFKPALSSIGKVIGPLVEKIKGFFSGIGGSGESSKVQGNIGKIKSAFESIKTTISSVVSIATSLWNAFGSTLTNFAVNTLGNFTSLLQGAFQVISGIFKVFSSLLKGDWKGAWDGIKQILSGALQVITALVRQALNVIKTVFKTVWIAVKGIVSGAFSGIKNLVTGGFTGVINFIKTVPGKIKDLGGRFKDAGSSIMHKIIDGIKNAAGFIGNIASGIWNAVKRLINSGIDRINSALSFRISLPLGKSITIDPPNIPHLAKGGIVTGPTLALIGEAGPEAVVPLGKGFGGGVNVYKITVNAPVGSSSIDIGRELTKHIAAYESAGGRRRR